MMVYGGKSKSTRRAYRTSVGDVLAAHGTHLSLSFALGDQFANSRNELRGNPHKCLGFVFHGSLVFSDCFFLCLLLVVRQYATHPIFVPSWRSEERRVGKECRS